MNSFNFNMSSIMLEAYESYKTMQTVIEKDTNEYFSLILCFSVPVLMLVVMFYLCLSCIFNDYDYQDYIQSLKVEKDDAEEMVATYLQMYEDEVQKVKKLRKELKSSKEQFHDSQIALFSIQLRYRATRDSAKKFLESFPEKNTTCCQSQCCPDPPRPCLVESSDDE